MQRVFLLCFVWLSLWGCKSPQNKQPQPQTTPSAPTSVTSLSTPTSAATAASQPKTPPSQDIESRLYPPASGLEASSFLESEKGAPYLKYHPNYAMDGDPQTAWNEGAPSSGAGEWLKLSIGEDASLYNISQLRIRLLNGYQKSEELYEKNSRIKTLQVTINGSQKETFTLPDDQEWQELLFPLPKITLESIELKVLDVYEGKKYQDLCISEVELYYSSSTAQTSGDPNTIPDWVAQQSAEAEILKSGIPVLFSLEPVKGGNPFPAESADLIAKAKAVLTSKTVVPVRISGDEPLETFPGLECSCLECSAQDEDEDSEGASFMVPCLVGIGPNLGKTMLTKTKKPPIDEMSYATTLFSEPGDLGKGAKAKAIKIELHIPNRAPGMSDSSDITIDMAAAYDEAGRLRVFIAGSFYTGAADGVMWLAWRKIDGADVFIGGVSGDPDKTSFAVRLVPRKLPLPKELTPASSPAPTSKTTSSTVPASGAAQSP